MQGALGGDIGALLLDFFCLLPGHSNATLPPTGQLCGHGSDEFSHGLFSDFLRSLESSVVEVYYKEGTRGTKKNTENLHYFRI